MINFRSPLLQGSVARPRVGVIASSDYQTATAKVLLQPEGVLSGWLPVLSQWTGAGWGMVCPPSPGDQVLIIPLEGSADHGVIIGRLFSNTVRPPQVNSGELVFQHQSGSTICLLNSGAISVTGDLHVSGDVYDGRGSLGALRNDVNNHTHTINNGGTTSVPQQQD